MYFKQTNKSQIKNSYIHFMFYPQNINIVKSVPTNQELSQQINTLFQSRVLKLHIASDLETEEGDLEQRNKQEKTYETIIGN